MARLCRAPINHKGILFIAGVFWNISLTVGIFGILRGDITSVEWLEIPKYATPLLAISYALIGVWGVMAFVFVKGPRLRIAVVYTCSALLVPMALRCRTGYDHMVSCAWCCAIGD